MANYLHPGIFIQEIPGSRSIMSASTSVAAFVGVTDGGPVNTPTLITSWAAYVRQFGSLIWQGFNAWAVYEFFQEGGASCYVVRLQDTGGRAATVSISNATLVAASNGAWGNNLGLCITNSGGASSTNTNTPAPQTPVFNLQVVIAASILDGASGSTTPSLSTQLLSAYVRQNGLTSTVIGNTAYYVLESFSGLTSVAAEFAQRINTQSMFVRVTTPGAGRPPNTSGQPTALAGGTGGTLGFSEALETLKTIQGLSLLAMPDTVGIVDSAGANGVIKQSQTINQGLALCESLGSLFYAADPPFDQSVQNIVAFKTGTLKSGETTSQALNSSYGALYYPWAWIFNPLSNSNVPIPPSGPALGRYAYTDSAIGVWKSPAGVNDGAMRTVVGVARALTDVDQDQLNPNGINALRNLIGYGNVIYGARTLSQDQQWTYLSVRRLFIFVEQSLKNSLQWVVFEPNDQSLWAGVSRDIGAFLTMLWNQGALFGATAQEAFFVTCDASNNPPETRAQGLLYIDIGLAPVYPAEFVVIRITQKTAGPDSGA